MSDAKKKKVKKDDSSSSAGFSSKPINNPHGSSGPTKKSEGFKNPFAKGKNPLAQIGDMIQSSQKAHEAKKKRSTEDRGGGKSLGGGEGGAGNGSADARREAVIAAAEARDKKHRAKTKPTKSSSSSAQQPPTLLSTAERRQVELEREQRAQQLKDQNAMSEEAQKAIQKAKADEATHAASLGYNPYETNKMNAGQARTATTTMSHGSVGATDKSTTTSSSSSSQAGTSLPAVAPPTAVAQADEEMLPVSEAFEEAFATLVTSNTDPATVSSALNILQKLVKNASTKQDDKFKRIRLANPKIKAAVSDVHGAMELLLTVGFTLFEDDATGETILVYSPDQNDVPAWLPTALHQMQQYEQTTKTK